MKWILHAVVGAGLIVQPATGQATLYVSEDRQLPPTVMSGYDGPSGSSVVASLIIGAYNPDNSAAHVAFQVSPADFTNPNCAQLLVVSPSSGRLLRPVALAMFTSQPWDSPQCRRLMARL